MKGEPKQWPVLALTLFLLALAGSIGGPNGHSFSENGNDAWTAVNLEELFNNSQNGTLHNASEIPPSGSVLPIPPNPVPLVSNLQNETPSSSSSETYSYTNSSGDGWEILPIEEVAPESGISPPPGTQVVPIESLMEGQGAANGNGCRRHGQDFEHCSQKDETIVIENLTNATFSFGTALMNYSEVSESGGKPQLKFVNTRILVGNVSGVVLKNAEFKSDSGKIFFNRLPLGQVKQEEDISPAFILQPNLVGVDSAAYPGFNQPATIEFYGLYNLRNPSPLRDGQPCGSYCSNFTYDPVSGTASMEVSGFSEYSIGEIRVSKVEHLDSSYTFLSDITGYVKTQDNNWSEQIPAGDFVRSTFEQNLYNGRVIDVYARKGGAGNVYFNVYLNGTTSPLIGTSSPLTDSGGWSYISVENLTKDADTFDFQMIGDAGSYAEFDYIHDTDVSGCQAIYSAGTYALTGNIAGANITSTAPYNNGKACIVINASNVDFSCNGHTLTGDGTANASAILVNGSLSPSVQYTNVTIRDCQILSYTGGIVLYRTAQDSIYNITAYNNTNAIYFYNSSLSNVTNTTTYNNTAGNGLFIYYYSNNNRFENITTFSNTDGLQISTTCSYNTVLNVTAYNNSQYGFWLTTTANYNNLTNNTAYSNGGTGAYAGFYLYTSNNSILDSNTAYNNSRHGFYIYSSSINNTLTSNTAYNNSYYGFYLHTSSYNNTLTSNTAYNNSQCGFYIDTYSNTFTNNTAYSNGGTGAYAGFYLNTAGSSNAYAYNNTLTGNTAYNNSYYGFYLSSSYNITLTSNTAYNNTQHGFYLTSSYNITLTSNTAYNNSRYGFYLASSSTNNTLTSNTAYSNGGTGDYAGFYIYQSSNNTLTSNTAYNNSASGFYLASATTLNNTLTSNSASNNTYGIRAHTASNNSITSNTIYNNSNSGIYLYLGPNTLTNNIAYNNTNGITLSTSSNNTLINNSAYNNSQYGIYLNSGSNNTLTNNTAYSNGAGTGNYAGFYVDASSNNNILTTNTAYNNSRNGFSFANNTNNSLTSNIAYNNSYYGFLLNTNAYNNTLTSNTAYNNTQNGIYLSSSNNNTLTNNIAYNNTKHGFSLGSCSYNNLMNNTAYYNTLTGFYLSGSSNNNLTYNAAYNNSAAGISLYVNANYNLVANSIAHHNGAEGIIANTCNHESIVNNTIYSHSAANGIYLVATSYTLMENNTIYSSISGLVCNAGSSYNNLTNNTAYKNVYYNFEITGGSDNCVLLNNTAYSVTGWDGLVISDSNNTNVTNLHTYNNTRDDVYLRVSDATPRTVHISNLSIDNPYGNYTNYTSINIEDTLDANSTYLIKWTANSSTLPAGYSSFAQKFVNISNVSGSPSIDKITFNWLDSEATGTYDDSKFHLYKYNGTWTDLNGTPDTTTNKLTLYSLTPASHYGILQNNLVGCQVVSTAGTYNLTANAAGAPNSVSGVFEITKACVVIASSDVSFNCAGYNITNDGTADAAGILINGSASLAYTNVTIQNCPGISGYEKGAYMHLSSNDSLRNMTAFNNTDAGIFFYGQANGTLDNASAYNNSIGIRLLNSNDTLLNYSYSYNNTGYGVYHEGSNYTGSEHMNITYNTVDGFYLDSGSNSNTLSASYTCYNGLDVYNSSASTSGTLGYCDSWNGWSENGHPGCTFRCTEIWHTFFGNTSGQLVLAENASTVFEYNRTAAGYNVYVVSTARSQGIVWPSLLALGRNTSVQNSTNDFTELDTALGISSSSDGVSATYSYDGSNPLRTIDRAIYQTLVSYVPVANSTNTTAFVTGILWDSSQGGPQFNGTSDVVFVAPVNASQSGAYGTYDYEIKVPAPLATYKGGNTVDIYVELT